MDGLGFLLAPKAVIYQSKGFRVSISIQDFDYSLPEDFIAKFPVEPRDSSKLLVYKNGTISHDTFRNLAYRLPENSLLVFNDTKVIPARLYFKKESGALIQLFLLSPKEPSSEINQVMQKTKTTTWECMIGNKKKWKEGVLKQALLIGSSKTSLRAEYMQDNQVRFSWDGSFTFAEIIKSAGEIPLPPYLNRGTVAADALSYQTVYSKKDGAVAAPTAGLHFTEQVLEDLKRKSIDSVFLTLHVGAGTFQPVKTDNALEHKMHEEQIVVTKETLQKIALHKGPIIPVGTTSMRSLESLFWYGQMLRTNPDSAFNVPSHLPYQWEQGILPREDTFSLLAQKGDMVGQTEIYLYPGYSMKVCNGIITNFHQPKSTLLLLIASLIGENWREVYKQALKNQYRFLSYGDSSLLLP